MITHKHCIKRYGPPEQEANMVVWDVPSELELGVIPKKLYCNKDLIKPLHAAFTNIIQRDLIIQLKTWDGCFNIRKKRSGKSPSLHSWGIAIDVNAAWNGFGKKPTMDLALVKCFIEAGFDWGGIWSSPDGMHFQLDNFE